LDGEILSLRHLFLAILVDAIYARILASDESTSFAVLLWQEYLTNPPPTFQPKLQTFQPRGGNSKCRLLSVGKPSLAEALEEIKADSRRDWWKCILSKRFRIRMVIADLLESMSRDSSKSEQALVENEPLLRSFTHAIWDCSERNAAEKGDFVTAWEILQLSRPKRKSTSAFRMLAMYPRWTCLHGCA